MLFLFSKSILFEIHVKKNEYLIGSQKYKSIPFYILKNTFISANWNRAIKFKPQILEDSTKIYNYMLEIDFYLNSNGKIVALSKENFFIDVLKSNFFIKDFILNVMKHQFKHTLASNLKINEEISFLNKFSLTIEKDILRKKEINHFVLFNNHIPINARKFKHVFLMDKNVKKFSWIINEKNQLIYKIPMPFYDELINNSVALDINHHEFILNFKSTIVNDLIIEGTIEDLQIYNKVLNAVKIAIENSNDKYTNWHLYTLTNNIDFLKKEVLSSLDASQKIKELAQIFRINYKNLWELVHSECLIDCKML